MGDWMKVEKATPDKPEIAILARKLGVSIGDAFLEWFRLYSWADDMTGTGSVPHLSCSDADKLARVMPKTAEHLASKEIEWVRSDSAGLHFSKFERHNGKSAKARALDTENKRNKRRESGDCPADDRTETGPDNRRQEESNRLLKGNRKAIGSSVGDGDRLPRLPVDAQGKRQREAIDLSGIDWSEVEAMAEALGRKVPALTPKDRRNWLRFAVMVQMSFSEDWLYDSVNAVVCAKVTKRTKQAHLYGVLKSKAIELGLGDLFAAMLRGIDIPKEVWTSGVLGGPQ